MFSAIPKPIALNDFMYVLLVHDRMRQIALRSFYKVIQKGSVEN